MIIYGELCHMNIPIMSQWIIMMNTYELTQQQDVIGWISVMYLYVYVWYVCNVVIVHGDIIIHFVSEVHTIAIGKYIIQ